MVSERDQAKMRRLAADLAAGETDERGTAEQRRCVLDATNAHRRRLGLEPLTDRPPEEGPV
jgi:hypothetical protein